MYKDRIAKDLALAWQGVGDDRGGGLVLQDVEVAHCLIRLAEMMHIVPCPIGDCVACNLDRMIWWDWSNSLSGPVRVRMQRLMRQCAVPLPPGPWEEVPTNAVPAAR